MMRVLFQPEESAQLTPRGYELFWDALFGSDQSDAKEYAIDELRNYIAALEANTLTAEEAHALSIGARVHHGRDCLFWESDDNTLCDCFRGQLLVKLKRISSTDTLEGTNNGK